MLFASPFLRLAFLCSDITILPYSLQNWLIITSINP